MRSGWNRRRRSERLRDGAGLGDDLELGAAVEERDEALADDFVVVDDEQGEGSGRCLRHVAGLQSVAASGRRTSIVVPPGLLSMLMVAPIVAALDRMLTRP